MVTNNMPWFIFHKFAKFLYTYTYYCLRVKQCWKAKLNYYESFITYVLFIIRYHSTYSKTTGRWTVVQRKTQHTYINVSEIVRQILLNRFELVGGMHQTVELSERDSRRISRTIALRSSPPTTELEAKKNQNLNKHFVLTVSSELFCLKCVHRVSSL